MTVRIAPSILSADFAALGDAIATVERGGADQIHIDVMDGHFVPNITIGPLVVRAIKRVAHVPLDVHLMIAEPDRYVEAFADAGAGMLSVHIEVVADLRRTLSTIKDLGVQAGIALNPSTAAHAIEEIAGDVDFVLVMSVNPGFGGQTFMPGSESKVRAIRTILDHVGNAAPIAIDGGIDRSNAARVVAAGTRTLVAGSTIFGADDPAAATQSLREAASAQFHARLQERA